MHIEIDLCKPYILVHVQTAMSVRKRNEYLDGDETEDDLDQGYDSDAAEASRGGISRKTSKRRRTNDDSEDGSPTESDDEVLDLRLDQQPNGLNEDILDEDSRFPVEDEDVNDGEPTTSSTKPLLKPSTPKQVAAAQKAARKSGVIYISRVPPFMKPQTLKHFLAPHARKGLGRVFLTPEDHIAHSQRVRKGGNKKKSFTDGWVEFVSKTDAQVAAETLNGNIIGGKKGNFYHDDIWSMKYLKGFKWSHLTEQIANENAERAARMREEIRKTKKENKAFVDDIEKGKMLAGMEEKRKAKQEERCGRWY